MKDKSITEHYRQIPGETRPWSIDKVRLDVKRLANEVQLTVKPDAV